MWRIPRLYRPQFVNCCAVVRKDFSFLSLCVWCYKFFKIWVNQTQRQHNFINVYTARAAIQNRSCDTPRWVLYFRYQTHLIYLSTTWNETFMRVRTRKTIYWQEQRIGFNLLVHQQINDNKNVCLYNGILFSFNEICSETEDLIVYKIKQGHTLSS